MSFLGISHFPGKIRLFYKHFCKEARVCHPIATNLLCVGCEAWTIYVFLPCFSDCVSLYKQVTQVKAHSSSCVTMVRQTHR